MLQAGSPAPAFALPDADMESFELSELRGKNHAVLHFYPKDDTPGCTIEAIDFTDHEDEFARAVPRRPQRRLRHPRPHDARRSRRAGHTTAGRTLPEGVRVRMRSPEDTLHINAY